MNLVLNFTVYSLHKCSERYYAKNDDSPFISVCFPAYRSSWKQKTCQGIVRTSLSLESTAAKTASSRLPATSIISRRSAIQRWSDKPVAIKGMPELIYRKTMVFGEHMLHSCMLLMFIISVDRQFWWYCVQQLNIMLELVGIFSVVRFH